MKYLKEIIRRNKRLILFYLVTGFGIAFFTNYKVDYFQKVIDGFIDGTLELKGILYYGGMLLSHYVLNYIDEYPAKKLEHGIYLDFKVLALRKISQIDYKEYQSLGTGKLIQRIENGAESGRSLLYDFWLCFVRELLPTIVFSIFFIWKINSKIMYILLSGYVIVFIVTNFLLKILYQIKERILLNEEQLNHYLVRGFMEMLVFRIERKFPSELKKAEHSKDEIVDAKVKMNLIHEAFFPIFALLIACIDVSILLYGYFEKTISVGEIVALITLIENAYTPIAIFNVLYVQYKLDKTSFQRFERFLDLKEDEQLKNGKSISSLSMDISIQDLIFAYDEKIILQHLSFSIKKGEKVAFVGESGSGKSTLIKIFAGLLKSERGSILYGNTELKDIYLESYYEHLTYISQDTPIFDGTIRENLMFGEEKTEEEILKVLNCVQLQELISNLEYGIDTKIGERGSNLSGGEKQRLALARLWFEDRDIIIFDEATSALDNLTEELVMKEVLQVCKDKTVITIVHRLNTIKEYDKIIVLKQGKIVEMGKFNELINNNGYFKKLYDYGQTMKSMER